MFDHFDRKLMGLKFELLQIKNIVKDIKHSQEKKGQMERKFYVSNEFGGSYYLARRSWYEKFDIGFREANDVCRTFGGYLLEINGELEYNYVAYFLSSIPSKKHFYTGGFYSRRYKGWYFYNEGYEARYFNTLTEIRPTREEFRCLAISNHVNPAKFEAIECYSDGTFICEIPEVSLKSI